MSQTSGKTDDGQAKACCGSGCEGCTRRQEGAEACASCPSATEPGKGCGTGNSKGNCCGACGGTCEVRAKLHSFNYF